MYLSLPVTLVLGLTVLFLVRKDSLKVMHALPVILFGFLLSSSTMLAARIGQVDTLIANLLGGSLSHH